MENMGWLKSYQSKGDAGRARKYYQITVKGKNSWLLRNTVFIAIFISFALLSGTFY